MEITFGVERDARDDSGASRDIIACFMLRFDSVFIDVVRILRVGLAAP